MFELRILRPKIGCKNLPLKAKYSYILISAGEHQ
jgi:hypothetical protein